MAAANKRRRHSGISEGLRGKAMGDLVVAGVGCHSRGEMGSGVGIFFSGKGDCSTRALERVSS